MAIKFDTQGVMIYLAMVCWVLAFVFAHARREKSGWILFGVGFAVLVATFILRWRYVGHVPFQNLFEIFIALATLLFPISLLSSRVWKIRRWKWDALIGVALLFPAGFVFSAHPGQLPPALQSGLFIPHVAAYMIAYIIVAKSAVQAAGSLIEKDRHAVRESENAAYKLARAAFIPMTAGLLLGAWWGKIAWGDYWNWDPKEMWSLATWMIFLAYFHFRRLHGCKFPKINSAFILTGTAAVVITLLVINLAKFISSVHSYAAG